MNVNEKWRVNRRSGFMIESKSKSKSKKDMAFDHPRILLPPGLSPGDAIGVIAPSSPFDREKFDRGIALIRGMGYRPVYPDTIFAARGYLAGPDPLRAEMLNACFADPGIRAVWCARGGYGAFRILPRIDYDRIRSNPKIFIGCSDITAILNTIYLRTGMVTFHGPMIASLETAASRTFHGIEQAVSIPAPVLLKPDEIQAIRSGSASGPVMGGNLATLNHLVGTPFEPDYSGCILLLEDIGEAPYRIDRMLTQMKMAGCFDRIAGVVAGSFIGCGDIGTVHQIIKTVFADLKIPVLAGFNFGHADPNMTIPIGLNARLDADAGMLLFEGPAVLI